MNSRRKFRMEQKQNNGLSRTEAKALEEAVLGPLIREAREQIEQYLPEGTISSPTITMNQNVLDALGTEEAQEVIRELAAATGEPEVTAEVVPNGQLSEEYGFDPRCPACNARLGDPGCTTDTPGAIICMGCNRCTVPVEEKTGEDLAEFTVVQIRNSIRRRSEVKISPKATRADCLEIFNSLDAPTRWQVWSLCPLVRRTAHY